MMFCGSSLSEILPATILLLVLVSVGGIIILRVRKMAKGRYIQGVPFTLDQLRALHAKGELSDEEFERAKASMIDNARKQ
jgi:uncharacterized membrane protein